MTTHKIQDMVQIAESATGARVFNMGSELLFDTVEQRDTAATAFERSGISVERVTQKFPGRPIRKPAIRLV